MSKWNKMKRFGQILAAHESTADGYEWNDAEMDAFLDWWDSCLDQDMSPNVGWDFDGSSVMVWVEVDQNQLVESRVTLRDVVA